MTGQDGLKPRSINAQVIEHPGIHNVPQAIMNPTGKKNVQIDIKVTGVDLSELENILEQRCIVCVQ
ncbi:MAG: hypothetical protein WAR83_07645 [Flavobacteriales bacterium]|nr:hypothetical protein [Flavobacteriales bacterium]